MTTQSPLLPMPAALLHAIGRALPAPELAAALLPDEHAQQNLTKRLQSETRSPLSLSLAGLDVVLHRHRHRQPEQPTGYAPSVSWWGLHALSAQTGAAGGPAWRGPWPQGWQAGFPNAQHFIAQLAHEPDNAVVAGSMACAQALDPQGRPLGLLGLFDPTGQRLHSLNLSRVGDWTQDPPSSPPTDATVAP